jgi:hypothetical protein
MSTWVPITTSNNVLSKQDIIDGKLRFIPEPGTSGLKYASIGFKVSLKSMKLLVNRKKVCLKNR